MKIVRLILNGLDYMYYRVAKAYFKWDGKSYITSYFTISLFLFGILTFPVILLMERQFLGNHINTLKVLGLSFQFIILTLVYIRYRNTYEFLDEKYKDEEENKSVLNGALVLLSLIIPWAILIFGSILKK